MSAVVVVVGGGGSWGGGAAEGATVVLDVVGLSVDRSLLVESGRKTKSVTVKDVVVAVVVEDGRSEIFLLSSLSHRRSNISMNPR